MSPARLPSKTRVGRERAPPPPSRPGPVGGGVARHPGGLWHATHLRIPRIRDLWHATHLRIPRIRDPWHATHLRIPREPRVGGAPRAARGSRPRPTDEVSLCHGSAC